MSTFRRISSPSILTNEEANAKQTRTFVGDGTAFLVVAGLLSLTGIAVGTAKGRVPMPLTEDRLHMVHPDESVPREAVTEQLFALETEGYAEPILLRSELSNDGIWQKGVTFYVTGDWADEKTPGAPTPEPTGAEAPAAETQNQKAELTKDEEPEKGEPAKVDQVTLQDALATLPEELLTKVLALGSPEKIVAATNDDLKAVGIVGPDITRVKNALKPLAG